jgi:chloramphenicol-sensitive protein RarD
MFLAVNWGTYIWAVNSNFVVETSLGYFMNPLFNVLFGAAFLGERPRPVQWTAIGLAATGVLYLTLVYGQVPYIALVLGSSFATYGLIKKKAKLGALESVTLESALLFLPAFAYLIFAESQNQHFLQGSPLTMTLLAASGIATMLPLLCFAAALRRLSLTVIGIMQYIAPSLQFFIGVVIFNEPMSANRLLGFVFIWAALILFSTESLLRHRTLRKLAK